VIAMQIHELTNHLGDSRDKFTGPVTAYGGTKVVQIQLRAGSEIPEHRTNADALIVVRKGRVVFGFGDDQVELTPDRLLHIFPDEPHNLRAVEDTELLLIRTER
jgi:quercetin dioxygenase-like cupin family protein